MRVITRHRPADPQGFAAGAERLLETLGRAPGFLSGELGRSPDEPDVFMLTTSWRDVGSMRRGLGSFEAKVALAPVMASASDELNVFEVLVEASGGVLHRRDSARAPGDASR